MYGHSHRRRSPANVADEVQWIIERYDPDQVWYADDVFTISHKWLYDYAAELRRRGLRIPFETISRADRMMREEVLAMRVEKMLGRRGIRRVAWRVVPFAAIVFNSVANERSTRALADRAIRFYGG